MTCVHRYSISPRRHYGEDELSIENTAVDCQDLTKIAYTPGLGAHFCARVQGLDLVLGSDTGTVPEF